MSPWSHHHAHISAGGFMGRVENMSDYLELMLGVDCGKGPKYNDQYALRVIHRKLYPRVKVDSLSLVMTRRDQYFRKL